MSTNLLSMRTGLLAAIVLFMVTAMLTTSWGFAEDDLAKAATWQIPSAADVRVEVVKWFETQQPTAAQRQPFDELWPEERETAAGDLLDDLAATVALVDANAKELVGRVQSGITFTEQPKVGWLDEEDVDPLVKNNLRLYAARALVQAQYFDEALLLLQDVEPEDVLDPAALMFYVGVVHHRLLEKEEGLKALGRLLERPNDIPVRYRMLAELMQGDLEQLKDDSLDHISRRMDDIQRRLDLGRAGKKVRDVEDGVIESLDKLIKKMEEQQQQQQQMAAAGSQGSSQSSRPADQSTPMGGKGPGEVDKKRLGKSADWGALPDKEREEAMQEIGRDFPAHYREVIEEYFKELAKKKRKSDR